MPSKYQNLIIHWFHIFILIFNHVDTIFNCIKIDILDRHFHSKIHFLLVYILHTRFLHNTFLLYTFLLYAITRYFGIIHFFQASSIKPDQSWVQSVKNIKLIISPAAVTFHTSCVWYIEHRWTTQKHTFIAGPQLHHLRPFRNLRDHRSCLADVLQYFCDEPLVWEHPIWGCPLHVSLLKAIRLDRKERGFLPIPQSCQYVQWG